MKNKFTNMGEGNASIDIEGVIGWDVTARSVKRELANLGEVSNIVATINSIGGYIDDGFGIYTALKNHSANVHVHITGTAASMGSVIAMAGDRVTIEPIGMGMIHPPGSVVWGTAAEMRKEADVLDTYESRIVTAYGRRGLNLTEDELAEAIANETWYTAQEFVDAGFADEVLEGDGGSLEQAANDDDATAALEWLRVARYKNTPEAYLAQIKNTAKPGKLAEKLISNGGSSVANTTTTGDIMSKFTQAELDTAVKAAVDAALANAKTDADKTAVDTAVNAVHDLYSKLSEHENASNFKAVARLARSGMSVEAALEHMDDVRPANTSEGEGKKADLTAEALQKVANEAAAAAVADARAAASNTQSLDTPAGAGTGVDTDDAEAVAKAQREAGAAAAARRAEANKGGIK